MRRVGFLVLFVLLWSCSKTEQKTRLELMVYNYDFEKGLTIKPDIYAVVDEKGVAEVIETTDSSNINAYRTKIKQEVLDDLTREITAKGEKYYKHEIDTLSLVCFPSSKVRLKVIANDGTVNSVTIGTNGSTEDTKYSILSSFYRFFRMQPQISKVDANRLNELLKKQEVYRKYVLDRDILELPPPPPPPPIKNIDEFLFVKKK